MAYSDGLRPLSVDAACCTGAIPATTSETEVFVTLSGGETALSEQLESGATADTPQYELASPVGLYAQAPDPVADGVVAGGTMDIGDDAFAR